MHQIGDKILFVVELDPNDLTHYKIQTKLKHTTIAETKKKL